MTNELVMLIAYVRPARRMAVGEALRDLGLVGWTESEAIGHGKAAGGHGVPHARFEVLTTAEQASACASAIAGAARTGQDGDGLVASLPVLSLERISDHSQGRASLP